MPLPLGSRHFDAGSDAAATVSAAASVTPLAFGLTTRSTRGIVRTMPRIDHVAVESENPGATAAFDERFFGARIVRTEGHPVMAYLGTTAFALHEPGGAGPHTGVRVRNRSSRS